jgi:uncharacterized protein YkwD
MCAIAFRLIALVVLLAGPPIVYNMNIGMEPQEAAREIPSAYEDGFRWAVETVQGQVARLEEPESGNGVPTPTVQHDERPDLTDEDGEIRSLEDGRALTGVVERSVLEETNRRREHAGLDTLSWDPELANVARAHSEDMSKHDYFAHQNLRGQSPADRASEAGYQCRRFLGFVIAGVGENLYQGWLFSSYTERSSARSNNYLTAQEIGTMAVDGLMGSPSHRENILRTHYERLGVGVAVSDDQKVYVTQKFC